MKQYDVKELKNNAHNIIIYKPDYVSKITKNGQVVYMNKENGFWVNLGQKGQKAITLLNRNSGLYIKDFVNQAAEKNIEEIDMYYQLIKICLDKNVLMIRTGEDYCWKPQPMRIKDMNLAEITWSLAGHCNLSCRHCYTTDNLHSKIKYDNELEDCILENIKSFCVGVTITGGEPFSHPRILYFIKELAPLMKNLTILTNGTLINEETADTLSKYPHIKVQISLDGSSKELHEYYRGKGSYENTLKAVKFLKERGVNVILSMVPMKSNIEDLENLIRLAETLGIKSLHFPLFQELGNGKDNKESLSPDMTKLCRFFNETMHKMAEGRMFNGHNYLMKKSLLSPPITHFANCGVGRGALIDYKGDVYPCSGLYEEEFKAGNVREKDVRDIYLNSEVFTQLRTISTNDTPECAACTFKVYCSGGCRARALHNNGDLMGKDPYCTLYKDELENYLWEMIREGNYSSLSSTEDIAANNGKVRENLEC